MPPSVLAERITSSSAILSWAWLAMKVSGSHHEHACTNHREAQSCGLSKLFSKQLGFAFRNARTVSDPFSLEPHMSSLLPPPPAPPGRKADLLQLLVQRCACAATPGKVRGSDAEVSDAGRGSRGRHQVFRTAAQGGLTKLIGIRFGGGGGSILYYNYNKKPSKPYSDYDFPVFWGHPTPPRA